MSLDELAALWRIEFGEALLHDGEESIVHRVTRSDGSPAILKMSKPGVDVSREAEALSLVAGSCAVRLLEHDHDRGALLLECADPDTALAGEADREGAIDAAVDLLVRWWRPVPSPVTLRTADEYNASQRVALHRRGHWLRRKVPAERLSLALEVLDEPSSEAVLLHTDLHLGNVLWSRRAGWLAIDPQPLVGPRAYDLEPLVRDADCEEPSVAASRLDRLAERAGVDRDEAARHVLARGLVIGSWSIETGSADWGWSHIEAVLNTVSRLL